MVPEIELQPFVAAHAEGAYVLDVREPFEYAASHVPGARLLPMARVHRNLHLLPRGERIYVICASGNRSKTVASWLRDVGMDAVSVAAGTGGWLRSGRPVAQGSGREHAR